MLCAEIQMGWREVVSPDRVRPNPFPPFTPKDTKISKMYDTKVDRSTTLSATNTICAHTKVGRVEDAYMFVVFGGYEVMIVGCLLVLTV